jgi:leader peptidase (prepilin peptidase) / N-methyltransferase
MFILFLILIFLCWGSFLNVVAYRITFDKKFLTTRSVCIHCNKIIKWYDNIPVFSWIRLKGKCSVCRKTISWLYTFTEIVTAILMTILFIRYFDNIPLFLSYFIFFSALIVATRTDLEAMVIPQLFSLWLVPVGIILSVLNFTKITVLESLLGAILGYGVLGIVAKVFKFVTKKDGLGQGDMELLAMIGSFLGPIGIWFALTIGSIVGLFIGGGYLLITKKLKTTRIPFGPFLALGAIVYFFYENTILMFLAG